MTAESTFCPFVWGSERTVREFNFTGAGGGGVEYEIPRGQTLNGIPSFKELRRRAFPEDAAALVCRTGNQRPKIKISESLQKKKALSV